MAINPINVTAYAQGLYEVSNVKKQCLGTIRETEDGRMFRYAKAGATITPGMALMQDDLDNGFKAQVQTDATASGATRVTVKVDKDVTANMFDDGYLIVNDKASNNVMGLSYPIASHSVRTGAGNITVILKTPLIKPIEVSDKLTIIPNPWNGVKHTSAAAKSWVGQCFVGADNGQYVWVQTGGIGVKIDVAATTITCAVGPTSTEGKLGKASAQDNPVVGYAYGTTGDEGKATPIMLFAR